MRTGGRARESESLASSWYDPIMPSNNTDMFLEARRLRQADAAANRRLQKYSDLLDRFLELSERYPHPGPRTIAKLEELSRRMDEMDLQDGLAEKAEAKRVSRGIPDLEPLDLLSSEWVHLRGE
jgi:enoyl-CoA hydratase/carnithine racemase